VSPRSMIWSLYLKTDPARAADLDAVGRYRDQYGVTTHG